MDNKQRADLFLQEIGSELKQYTAKWKKYFFDSGLPFDIDVLNDTIIKCYDIILKKGLREGKKESWNYLFKAFKMNSIRELQYARNKNRDEVEDINILYETYMNKQHSAEYKIASDLWTDFQVNYIARTVEFNWDKNTFYLFKLKFILQLDDDQIKKKSKNPNWKKDIRALVKWLKASVRKEDIVLEFNQKYPDIDLSVLSE